LELDLPPLSPSLHVAGDTPPAPPRQRRSALSLLSAYLPLLLMAFLALGTWWLAKNTPIPGDEARDAPLRHEPDYEMHRFAVERFTPDGRLRAQLEGDALRHYPDTDTLEIDNVRIRAIGPDGAVTVATARRAIANGAATEVQLVGGAEVVREASAGSPAVRFNGEFLHAFLDTERIRSHLPVTVVRGGTTVRAESIDYTHLDRVLRFGGRMQTVFEPRGKP
jgi:lipopolysaccharide export system protein LptC